MEGIITTALGLGLAVSLMFSEMFGLAAGGMIVPGYMALHLDNPLAFVATIMISYLTFFVVHAMGSVTIIYGRRRTVLMILVGFLFGWLLKILGSSGAVSFGNLELQVVGYIIPGLIAIWIDRQGLIETITALITASVIVRLGLILVTGGEMSL